MSRYFRAEIVENLAINRACNLLTFLPSPEVPEPEPGQFYMIGAAAGETASSAQGMSGGYRRDPLLKRPFSLFRKRGKGLQLLYRIRGKGTMFLRGLEKGASIEVLGPLGNSYPLPLEKQIPLIVAGGIGIASVFYLAEKLAESGNKPHIFYGVRDEGELFLLNEVRELTEQTHISTDDGSCGEKGCITDMVKKFVSGIQSPHSGYVVYSCGPRPMLEALSWIIKDKQIPAYVSMEERMACGIGACLGCVIKTKGGHTRVCKEGPVFPIEEIVW